MHTIRLNYEHLLLIQTLKIIDEPPSRFAVCAMLR